MDVLLAPKAGCRYFAKNGNSLRHVHPMLGLRESVQLVGIGVVVEHLVMLLERFGKQRGLNGTQLRVVFAMQPTAPLATPTSPPTAGRSTSLLTIRRLVRRHR